MAILDLNQITSYNLDELKGACEYYSISQKAIADLSNCTTTYVSRYIGGKEGYKDKGITDAMRTLLFVAASHKLLKTQKLISSIISPKNHVPTN